MSVAISLKGRIIWEVNFCGIYFCDLWLYLLKRMLSLTTAKENATSYEKLFDFQGNHPKTGHNSQEFVPHNTVILGYWTEKFLSQKSILLR